MGGRYRIGELIARGGMASVFRGHDEQLDRPVAIKLMRPDLAEDAHFTARFAAEARSAASVTHPNVVAIYDVGTEPVASIVMELVDGGDLSGLLRQEGQLDPAQAAQIAADVAAALEAAHAAGVVHRDVKPGNVLLRSDGRAAVADFGIARAMGAGTLTKTGALLGSVDYISPEQARGDRADERSDLYGLGVVLYEMLTGRRPFDGDGPYAVATARIGRPPPDPRMVAPAIPRDLASIVQRAMAESPADRYANAEAMRVALHAWIERAKAAPQRPGTELLAPVMGPRVAAAKDPRRPARRGPVIAWAALLLLLLAGGGYGVGRALIGDDNLDVPLPEAVLGSIGGHAFTPTPSPTTEPSPSDEASAVNTPSDAPTRAPATRAPVPTPAPTAASVAFAGPDDAVAAFYDHVVDGRFDDAYALWSPRMKATYERQGNLDDRFANTAAISFSSLYVADQSATRATVQANFTETYDSGSSRDFVGYWRLIRSDGRWLLDEPTY
ncbi:MAG: protein kinase [Chloroflexi bacterium]|nr:protein kinase [Chloroflexota bacterium]